MQEVNYDKRRYNFNWRIRKTVKYILTLRNEIDERIVLLRETISQTTSDYDKEKLQERLGRLTGGVAVLKVGGSSEVEVGELKDRINDALCATKAAAEEGIVPGGGSALLYASKVLDNLKGDNFDQQNGIDIVKVSIRRPLIMINNNAGLSGILKF